MQNYAECRREDVSVHTGLELAMGGSGGADYLPCFVLFLVVDSSVDGKRVDSLYKYGAAEVRNTMPDVVGKR